ncbi:CHAP domain-containing protein [Nocardioides salsibiostraticola]
MPPDSPRFRSPFRAVVAFAVTGLVAVLLPLMAAPSAQAGSTILCSGYSSCAQERKFNGGYKGDQGNMYWRMYSGTNCTNYVAYRLIKNGMTNERPWSSTGNAYNWGLANSRITDNVPAVGSVAWFNRGVSGAGSVGHVAYVEEVVSPTEIVVSESNWRGEFDWRRITKDSSSWPSGFIHFNDKAMKNTAPPVITGDAAVDERMTVSAGSWSPTPTTVTYAWLADGVAIAGATSSSFIPTEAERGKQLSVRVAAAATGYPGGAAYSAPTDAVARARFDLAAPPQVSGRAEIDEVLTTTPGGWSPAPATIAYAWSADGKPIPGANGPQLAIDNSLAGKRIVASVLVRREGYIKGQAGSSAVGPVVAGTIETPEPYAVSGRPRVGNTVSLRGSYTPQDATETYTWLRDGKPIAGANDPSYRLSVADAGREVVGQVALSKRNYLTRVERVSRGPVTSKADVRLKAVGKTRQVLVVVRVSGRGFGRPPGEVKIKIGRRQVQVPLVRGKAKVWVRQVRPGNARVVAKYLGSDIVARGNAVQRTDVRR